MLFDLPICINPIFMKLNLSHLFIFRIRQQFIQLGHQADERCGAIWNRNSMGGEASLNYTSALIKNWGRYIFWDVFIKQQVTHYCYRFAFTLDHTKLSMQSQPSKTIDKIPSLWKFKQITLSKISLWLKIPLSPSKFQNLWYYLEYTWNFEIPVIPEI